MKGKNLLIRVLTSILGVFLFSCGGESSSPTTSSETTNPITITGVSSETTNPITITGVVQSSIVKGATICVNGTNTCAVTDDNGTFDLKVNKLPIALEVRFDSLPIGIVEANSTYISINPLTLANDNLTLAPLVRSFIHALANDTLGNATIIDVSKIKVKTPIDKPLVDILKDNPELVNLQVEINNETLNATITCLDGCVAMVNYQPVFIDTSTTDLQFWALEQFLSQSDGKTLTFIDANGNKVATCKLDAEAPNLVKFEDCSNPDWNSNGWAIVTVDDITGKAAIKTSDGEYYDLISLDPTSGFICYSDNGEQYCAYISPSNPSEDQNKIEYIQLINFLVSQNGTLINITVNNSDDIGFSCGFIINPVLNSQINMIKCRISIGIDSSYYLIHYLILRNYINYLSDKWIVVKDEKTSEGWKLEGVSGYITSFDPNTKTLTMKILDNETNQYIILTLTFYDYTYIPYQPI